MIRIVLFDIDGTLIRTGGAGRRAFVRAVEDVVGHEIDDSAVSFGGRTDLAICRGLLAGAGILDFDPPLKERVLSCYLVHLESELSGTDACRPCSGVEKLLDALSASCDFRIGLLTGNIEAAARRKLAHIGIDRFFPFGAFGSDDEERDHLVGIARERAAGFYGAEAIPAPVVLVGDTPLDIRCARAGNARILAVATGIFDRTQLEPYGPDILMDDLTRTDSVMAALYDLSDLPPPPARGSAIPGTGG